MTYRSDEGGFLTGRHPTCGETHRKVGMRYRQFRECIW